MQGRNLRIYITVMATLLAMVYSKDTCKKINSCSCSYEGNKVIDLSPLAGNPSKWTDVLDTQQLNKYSYNPCKGFTEGSCTDVAWTKQHEPKMEVCQSTGTDYYDCGSQDSASFINEDTTGQLYLKYQSTDSFNTTRTSQIILQCDQDGPDTFGALGETAPGSAFYVFTLSSAHCCPKTGGGGSSSSSLSIGAVITIIFFSLLISYFVVGVVVQKSVRKASGKEMLPNYSLWSQLPGLIRDGFRFVFTCGKARIGYQSV